MILKNKYLNPLIISFIGIINLQSQISGLEILNKVEKNLFDVQNAYYSFKIVSDTKSNLFPLSGEYFFEKGKYIIKTDEIDQLYDGLFFYTIVHENKEIIKSSEESYFFNITPDQFIKRINNDFFIEIESSDSVSYYLIASYKINPSFILKVKINKENFFIEKIDIKDSNDISVNSFLTISYNFNLKLTPSLFKFDINKYPNYLIIENWKS